MTYFLDEKFAKKLLESGGNMPLNVQLHTGDPGVNGTANVAVENTKKEMIADPSVAAHPYERRNPAALEWVEVKGTETFRYVSLWNGAEHYMNVKLTFEVAVNIGDTFRINKEKLVLKLRKEE